MDNMDSAREWLHFARMDLESARYLQGMRPIPHEIICYHCQQCAEKSLKAILTKHLHELRKIHDLVSLLKEAVEVEPVLSTLVPVVAGLTDYAIVTRYPPSMQIGVAESSRALQDAEAVISACSSPLILVINR